MDNSKMESTMVVYVCSSGCCITVDRAALETTTRSSRRNWNGAAWKRRDGRRRGARPSGTGLVRCSGSFRHSANYGLEASTTSISAWTWRSTTSTGARTALSRMDDDGRPADAVPIIARARRVAARARSLLQDREWIIIVMRSTCDGEVAPSRCAWSDCPISTSDDCTNSC